VGITLIEIKVYEQESGRLLFELDFGNISTGIKKVRVLRQFQCDILVVCTLLCKKSDVKGWRVLKWNGGVVCLSLYAVLYAEG